MQVMRVEALGQPLVAADVPRPEPGPGEILLRVRACGLNFADTLMIDGRYQEKPPLPFAPGIEVAGSVVALGAGVAGPAVGSRMAAIAGFGGLAEYVTVPVATAVLLPDALSDEAAAGFLIAYGTSHVALALLARLRPRETLLVTGASGGVGLTAVEIGCLLGARVVAVARGTEKQTVAAAAGAALVFDPEEDVAGAMKAIGGADVVYETVGGALFDACLRAARPGARILPIGFAGGAVAAIPANRILVKNQTAIGFYFGGWVRDNPAPARASLATLLTWHALGRLRPHVGKVLSLAEANAGIDLLRRRAATGKVVIRVA